MLDGGGWFPWGSVIVLPAWWSMDGSSGWTRSISSGGGGEVGSGGCTSVSSGGGGEVGSGGCTSGVACAVVVCSGSVVVIVRVIAWFGSSVSAGGWCLGESSDGAIVDGGGGVASTSCVQSLAFPSVLLRCRQIDKSGWLAIHKGMAGGGALLVIPFFDDDLYLLGCACASPILEIPSTAT